MIKFSEQEKARIREAVKKAESKTSGEIATAIIPQSNDYAIFELLAALLIGLVYSVVMIAMSSEIESWLSKMFWNYHVTILTGFYIFSTFIVILIFYLLANIPAVDRLIVPNKLQQAWVKRRAGQHFFESGVAHTRDATGILIFISVLEHRVELLADKGISQKVSADKWQEIVNGIIEGIKTGKLCDRLCLAITECGDLLAKDFPIKHDDENELSDGIVELKN